MIQPRPIPVLLEDEGVGAIAPLEGREARLLSPLAATEERLIGLVQARQRVLQDMRVDGSVRWERGPDLFELGFLLVA